MLVNRVRRLWQALMPSHNFADLLFIEDFLDSRLAALFFAMAEADRAHCLYTARRAQRLAAGNTAALNQTLLLKAALLHDVGRRQGDMSVWQRVAAVLLDTIAPGHARRLAGQRGHRGSFSHALYVYYQHPALGAKLIRQAGGGEALAALVALHHSAQTEPPELAILQEADGMS